MSQRIARLTTRINRGELFARVYLVELQQVLSSLASSLQQREKEYQALIQAQCVNAEAIHYKTLKILQCHVGTPTHSIWVNLLITIDKVFCAINTLKVIHTSEYKKEAHVLLQSLRQDCLGYILKLLYLPNREVILEEEFMKLSAEEKGEMLERNRVSAEQFHAATQND